MTTRKAVIQTPIYVTYTCSKCKKFNHFRHIIREERTLYSGNELVWQDDKEDSSQAKKSESNENQAKPKTLIDRIFKEQENGEYFSAELNHKCNYCGHKEAWFSFSKRISVYILQKIAILCVFLSILSLISKSMKLFAGTCILIITALLCEQLLKKYLRYKISKLPKESLPHLSVTHQNMKK